MHPHLPPDVKRRAGGLLLALLVQVLLAAMLLTLTPDFSGSHKPEPLFIGANIPAARPAAEEPPTPQPPQKAPPQPSRPAPPAPPTPRPETPEAPQPPAPPPVLDLSHQQMSTLDIAAAPKRAPAGPLMGPPAPASTPSDDTPLVGGSGPNGEPLYAAAWYREPYDDELKGYLSTAHGPGWGRIACRTATGYRVEECVVIGEYPEGSGIARAVLAAAWQFRVRPPRKGGRDMVGEWVRIHIDYGIRRPPARY